MLTPKEKALLTRYQSLRIESEKILAKAKALEGDIIKLMEREGLTSYEVRDKHTISYTKAWEGMKFSSTVLQKKYKEIYEECKAPSKRSAYISYK